jgi:WD40 repeat protein
VRIWDPRTWSHPVVLDAGEGPALALAVTPDGASVAAGYQSGAIAIWDVATHELRLRIGGRTRDHGSCAALDTEAWADATQRATVAAACATSPGAYLTKLAARSHQRLDGQVDVTWDWLPRGNR